MQAANDFCVFGLVSIASLASGKLLHHIGWNAVNMTIFPFVIIAVLLIVFLLVSERRVASTPA